MKLIEENIEIHGGETDAVSEHESEILENKTELDFDINVLRPVKTVTVPIFMNKIRYSALLDSGAVFSLVRKSILTQRDIDHVNEQCVKSFTGLGGAIITTLGIIKLRLDFFGHEIEEYFHVVKDNDVKHDIILGSKSLKACKIGICMKNRMIIKRNLDGSNVKIYVDEDDKVLKVINENLPIYAKHDTKIEFRKCNSVPVTSNINMNNEVYDKDTELYFEGSTIKKKIHSVDGIVDMKSEMNIMIVADVNANRKNIIKKNEMVGRISTLVDVEDTEENDYKSWTKEKLKEEINLEGLNDEEKKTVLEMILSSAEVLSTGDDDIGHAKITPHKIHLTSNTPIWHKPRRFAEKITEETHFRSTQIGTTVQLQPM